MPVRTCARRTGTLALAGLVLAGLVQAGPAAAAPEVDGEAPAVSPPARQEPDVLVRARAALPSATVERVKRLAPERALVLRAGSVRVAAATVSAVGVGPEFRSWTAPPTSEAVGVWEALARGEAVASHATAARLRLPLGGQITLAGPTGAPITLRLGALATTGLPANDLVLGDRVAGRLGLPAASGLLLRTDEGADAVALAAQARTAVGDLARVDLLSEPASPVATLSGGTAAEAFGAFSYRYFADGTIQPDAAWVRDNIRTETVPVFGQVTCHRLMLPQLRGALAEVAAKGLAGTLKTYDGCYVPRFIERNPSRAISLHTWGIAIDLDASTNYRGIRGTMHPDVITIFKRWGFEWGGDWAFTDPMHFELGTLLTR